MRLFGFFNIARPFSTNHWMTVLSDPAFLAAVRNSLVLGLTTAVLGVLLYALLAYTLVRAAITGESFLNLLVWLPWAVPGILLGLAFLWLLLSLPIAAPLYGTFGALVLVLLVKEMPIGVHMMKTTLIQIAIELEQVARVCGAGWFYTFRRIVVPLISPIVVSIFAIVFMASIRDIDTIILPGTASKGLM